jgi:hypothetical protein
LDAHPFSGDGIQLSKWIIDYPNRLWVSKLISIIQMYYGYPNGLLLIQMDGHPNGLWVSKWIMGIQMDYGSK